MNATLELCHGRWQCRNHLDLETSLPLIRKVADRKPASISTSTTDASSGATGTPSIEMVVGEKTKVRPPASISVLDLFSEQEKGPLILAVTPLGIDAVPETFAVRFTNAKTTNAINDTMKIELIFNLRAISYPFM